MAGPDGWMVGSDVLTEELAGIVGTRWVVTDPSITERRTVDWTGRRGPHRAIVVQPADALETAAVLAACASHRTPVVPQGGNTGLVEGSVPARHDWVVLSTDRMAQIGDLDDVSGQITAGAGVPLAALHHRLKGTGWRFAVDLGSRDSATIGGLIATNAGGMRVFRLGGTRAQLLGVQVARADGSVIDTMRQVDKDNTRYDLAGLVCGSEGTLGVVTAARLRLVLDPPEAATTLVGFPTVRGAFDAAWTLRRTLPDAEVIELIGPGCLELVCDAFGLERPFGDRVGCSLLVEARGRSAELVLDGLASGIAALAPSVEAIGIDDATRSRLWRYRDLITDALARPGQNPLKLDIAVPAAVMATFHDWTTARVEGCSGAQLYVFGHVCDNNLHLNITGLDADERVTLERDVLEHVVTLGGSISAEHGIGRRRVEFVESFRDSTELALARSIKAAWDPTGVMNPGVMFS